MKNSKISSKIKKIDRLIFIDIALILLTLALFNYTNIDVAIQNHFFDFETKTWLFDCAEPIKRFFFYNLPKFLLGGVIIFFLVANSLTKKSRKFTLIILGLVLIPLIGGTLKRVTNIYCPCQLEIYDGKYPYVKILESYPKNFRQQKSGKCFPAGHAVTGFALMILFFGLKKKSHKLLGLFGGIGAGWILGFYQMAKGVHFLSDTVVSMFCSFLLAAIIARFYEVHLAKRSN